MCRVIGIDVGLEGGIASIRLERGSLVNFRLDDLPTVGKGASRRINVAALRDWIMADQHDHAFVEGGQSMPRQGVSSAFRYGRAVGMLEAIVVCCNIPITIVAPISWKRYYNLKGSDKELSRQMAIRRFPCAASALVLRRHHGRAESLLIAAYGATLLAPAVS